MVGQSSHSAEEYPAHFDNATTTERYFNIVIYKNLWEEQSFKFRDGLDYYGLEMGVLCPQLIRRKHSCSYPRKAGPCRRHNHQRDTGPAQRCTQHLEDIDYNSIKDALYRPNTEWNITTRIPAPSADPTCCQRQSCGIQSSSGTSCLPLTTKPSTARGILAFPCLIFALCRRRVVPTFSNDKYTIFRTGWDHKHYMKKMDVADTIPIQVAMPTPAQSENTEAPAHAVYLEDPAGSAPTAPPAGHQGSPSAASATQGSFIATPTPSAPTVDPQPSPADKITRRGHIFPPKGRKRSGRFNARLGAVLKQFQVDDIQNPPGQKLWHRLGQSW
ncbi:hypothetical protein V6N13_124375 [Hibiscus sabdariffa]